MQDVFAVAVLVKNQLQADGYRVVMTKNSASDRVSLGQRAAVANRVHAALAFSIHDQAGPNGGIQFSQGNNTVYYQSVGGYRTTPNGTRITFTHRQVAATSKQYGQIFQAQRSAAEGHSIRLQGDVGYDLGSRGLPAGDMWMVQLLSRGAVDLQRVRRQQCRDVRARLVRQAEVRARTGRQRRTMRADRAIAVTSTGGA